MTVSTQLKHRLLWNIHLQCNRREWRSVQHLSH